MRAHPRAFAAVMAITENFPAGGLDNFPVWLYNRFCFRCNASGGKPWCFGSVGRTYWLMYITLDPMRSAP